MSSTIWGKRKLVENSSLKERESDSEYSTGTLPTKEKKGS